MANSTHSRFIPEGMTRDCLDPWVYIEIRADGGIAPCCARGPIGDLATQSLAEIMNGEKARSLRYALLSGQPDRQCRDCGLRGATDPGTLRLKVEMLMNAVTVPDGFETEAYLETNPDVREAGVEPRGHFLEWGRLEGRAIIAP